MTTIRILVGTRKGAFILTSDAGRKQWTVDLSLIHISEPTRPY